MNLTTISLPNDEPHVLAQSYKFGFHCPLPGKYQAVSFVPVQHFPIQNLMGRPVFEIDTVIITLRSTWIQTFIFSTWDGLK